MSDYYIKFVLPNADGRLRQKELFWKLQQVRFEIQVHEIKKNKL